MQDNGPSRQLMIREYSGNTGSHPISPAPLNTQDTPEVWRDQRFLQIFGDVALPPLKSSRGDSISCWQNTATQRPKAQRGSNIIPSRTLRIQPLFLFLSKTCRLVLLSVTSSFLFFFFVSTYLLHIKSCKENSADSRSRWMCQGIPHQSQSQGKRERERKGEMQTTAAGGGVKRRTPSVLFGPA